MAGTSDCLLADNTRTGFLEKGLVIWGFRWEHNIWLPSIKRLVNFSGLGKINVDIIIHISTLILVKFSLAIGFSHVFYCDP